MRYTSVIVCSCLPAWAGSAPRASFTTTIRGDYVTLRGSKITSLTKTIPYPYLLFLFLSQVASDNTQP